MKKIILVSILITVIAFIMPLFFPAETTNAQISEDKGTWDSYIDEENSEKLSSDTDDTGSGLRFDENTTIRLSKDGEVQEIKMDEYLIGVVASEMPYTFELEALKAQAVAARTYALNKLLNQPNSSHPDADVCSDYSCCCAYKSVDELKERWGDEFDVNYEKILTAVEATNGLYVDYGGSPIVAAFHSSSAGSTENSENVWTSALPYLTAVSSPETEELVPNFESRVTVSEEEFKSTVLASYPSAAFEGEAFTWISNVSYTESGRVLTANVGGIELSGNRIRTLFGLRSAMFTVICQGGDIIFNVKGFGHGVGMSQYGANIMAQQGSGYEDIILHYYQGTRINNAEELFED